MASPGGEERDLAAVVRRWWRRFNTEGPRSFVADAPEDVEFRPMSGRGEVLRGRDAMLAHLDSLDADGARTDAVAHSVEQIGRAVVVRGSLRRHDRQGMKETTACWVYCFDADGRLRRADGGMRYPDAVQLAEDWTAASGA